MPRDPRKTARAVRVRHTETGREQLVSPKAVHRLPKGWETVGAETVDLTTAAPDSEKAFGEYIGEADVPGGGEAPSEPTPEGDQEPEKEFEDLASTEPPKGGRKKGE